MNVMRTRLSRLLLICVKHIDRIAKLGDKNYSPLSQNMNSDLVHPLPDDRHWLSSHLVRARSEWCAVEILLHGELHPENSADRPGSILESEAAS